MNIVIQSAIAKLSEQYEIVNQPLFLSDFFRPGGKNNLVTSLIGIRQDSFENNQRIIVVQDSDDQYLSINHAGVALTFLQQSLQKVDISNFFVIVISGNPDISSELEWVKNNCSTDSEIIGHLQIDIPYSKQSIAQDTFCSIPWLHLHATTTGEIAPCCISDPKLPLGDLKTQDLNDIINGQKMKTMRLNMLSNQPCSECVKCYDVESANMVSRRQLENQRWAHLQDTIVKNTNRDGSINSFAPTSVDLRLNNICNLKCRTCSGQYSNQLAVEEKKIFNNSINFNKTLTSDQRMRIFNKIIKVIDQTEVVYFAGGEPLIMREHYAILDRLISLGKTNLEIFYNTNFTNLTYKDKNVLDYWKQFSNIKIAASIDGHGKTLEYTRHGAIWELIQHNLQMLNEQCPHVNFTVTSTVSLLSAESIMELQQQWHTQGILNIDKFAIHPVLEPYLNLQMLKSHHKTELSKKIKEHCSWLETVGANTLRDEWLNLEIFMLADDKTYAISEFREVHKLRDLERREKFELVYPQYKDLF